jgi:hypothetical protein
MHIQKRPRHSPSGPLQHSLINILFYHSGRPEILNILVRRGADKSLAFPIFVLAAEPNELFLDGLKKLEQRSHTCVELKGEYVE